MVKTGKRIDGRATDTIRPIVAETGLLPRTHGSALFTRGETQGLVVTTLGTGDDEQMIDALHGTYKSNFMLHYNFPPYSVGEVGRLALPDAVRLATVSWHGAPCRRFCLRQRTSRTRSGLCPRSLNPTVQLDGVGLWWFPVDDGRRRAAEGTGGRCRHGLDPRKSGDSPF